MITRKKFRKLLAEEILILDGGMGTLLQEWGLPPGEAPESWNLARPEAVEDIHRTYAASGADVILTNTFGATRLKMAAYGLGDKVASLNRAAVRVAKKAANGNALVGLSVGPLGKSLYPLGDLTFEKAYELFAEQVKSTSRSRPDLVIIETLDDIREARAAAMAARDNFPGPVLVQMSFSQGDATLTGMKPASAACTLEALDIDAVGANCSLGPKELFPVMEEMASVTDLPLLVQPNAGLPELRYGKTVFPGSPGLLAEWAERFREIGVNILGGCCGTGPAHITAIRKAVKSKKPVARKRREITRLCGRSAVLEIGEGLPVGLLGERINPSSRRAVAEAVMEKAWNLLRDEAQAQAKAGAKVVDVNVGLPGVDEGEVMRQVVRAVQSAVGIPLCIDSSDPAAMEQALMEVEGKALLNSTTGEKAKLDTVVPLARRYGAALVGLTLDGKGIPQDAKSRLRIAKTIVKRALAEGIRREDIFIDPLVLSVGTETKQALEGLESITLIKEKLGVRVLMGITNISHGMPGRTELNSSYLAMALASGLDLPMANPFSAEMTGTVSAANLILGNDPYGKSFLEGYELQRRRKPRASLKRASRSTDLAVMMVEAVLDGNGSRLLGLVDRALKEGWKPQDVSEKGLLKGLTKVGEKFKSREFFLPQVVLSAEAVQKAYGKIKPLMRGAKGGAPAGKVIMATVKGDIHEIGKNIVLTLLENHGFEVTDLGMDVSAEDIVRAARDSDADVVGLSALMTTTMVEMPKAVKALKDAACRARIMVGGAVVTKDFARRSGAHGWAPDAMGAVDEAKRLVALARKR
ncbi:MAG: homocysteine S-methyltransferase family protein [Planctomycetota bacterium]|jgi:5-methyltetrahydrofolate--homocysteine methyltransferase